MARFIDTPGLEDSVALFEFLSRQEGETEYAQLQAFLRGPEAHAAFEQEAKVVRALLDQVDAAMLVIDTREPVLPKYRAEIRILIWCARPVMPILNFVRDPRSRRDEWLQVLRESGLHVCVEFDAVAPFTGAEQRLYTDLGTLLPSRRQDLLDIVAVLTRAERERAEAACRLIVSRLIDVAAMRRTLPREEFENEQQQSAFVAAFRGEVRGHAQRAVEELLALYAFRRDDAELADWPALNERWEDDLFNPELLLQASARMGLGAMLGAGVGAVVDVALAGLSLGAGTALGATVGGAVSGGWRPLWRKLENRLTGVQELTVEISVIVLLADRLLELMRALALRGHAAQDRLSIAVQARDGSVDSGWGPLLSALEKARGHPEWERGTSESVEDEARERQVVMLGQQLWERLAASSSLSVPDQISGSSTPKFIE